MEPNPDFGTWLKRRRHSLDITQDELAQQVAYSVFTIRRVETGDLRPSKPLAAKLAAALGIPSEERPAFVDFARGRPGANPPFSHSTAPELPAHDSQPGARHNLPSPLTSFVGREAEVEAACALLARPDVRLLTLTGPGGVGKTRLALRVAAQILPAFPDGACFCSLGSLADSGLVASAIACELGLVGTRRQPIEASLKYYLKGKRLLLALDSFEPVLEAASLLSALLAAAPQLKLLVTSRILLHLSAEYNFPVAPFALPSRDNLTPQQLCASPAVRLFVERAAALKPGFQLDDENGPTIAQTCRRLDGLPLAIELAAARLRMLSPQALLARLESRLPSLTEGPRDAPERQQTLHSTIAWSYQRLGLEEQRVFSRLAVFAGSGSLDAADAVGGGGRSDSAGMMGILGTLADNSLLQFTVGPEGEPRFAILDTLREYGLEQLAASGEEPAIRCAHAEYYTRLAEAGGAGLKGHEQILWARRLSADLDNFRSVLAWAIRTGQSETALRLGAALRLYWERHGDWDEGRGWLDRIVSLDASPGLRARALLAAAILQFRPDARIAGMVEESRTLARVAGDLVTETAALATLGRLEAERQGVAAGLALLDEALAVARSAADPWTTAWTLFWIGHIHLHAGYDANHVAAARAAHRDSAALYEQCGDSLGKLMAQGELAYFDGLQARDEASYHAAMSLQERIVAQYRKLNARHQLGAALNSLGEVARYHGDFASARRAYEEAIALNRSVGLPPGVPLDNLAAIALHDRDWQRAANLLVESRALSSAEGVPRVAGFMLTVFAGVFAVREEPAVAATLLGAARSELDRLGENLEGPDQPVYDEALAIATQGLSASAFLAAWEQGRAMSAEEAFSYGRAQLA